MLSAGYGPAALTRTFGALKAAGPFAFPLKILWVRLCGLRVVAERLRCLSVNNY